MSKTALFIRHRALPGRRDDVLRVWEKHVKPRVESNPAHEAYFFCYDNNDPNVICVFQLYTDLASMQHFLSGAWYADYLNEVSRFIEAQPQIVPAARMGKRELKMITLPPPRATLAGCMWLPRIIAKARLLQSGALPSEYETRFCHPTGVDAQFLKFFGLEKKGHLRPRAETVGAWFGEITARPRQ